MTMKMKHIAIAAATAAAIMFASQAHAASSASKQFAPARTSLALTFQRPSLKARICKSRVSESGWASKRYLAVHKAKRNWSAKVASIYGRGFARWNKSTRRKLTCTQDRIDDGYLCRARATPCFPNGQLIGS